MSQRDERGGCPQEYGQCNLSPSSATELTLNDTARDVLAFPKAVKAVMIVSCLLRRTNVNPGDQNRVPWRAA